MHLLELQVEEGRERENNLKKVQEKMLAVFEPSKQQLSEDNQLIKQAELIKELQILLEMQRLEI